MPRVQGKRLPVCIQEHGVFLKLEVGYGCDHVCTWMPACIFACTNVRVRGWCEGFPSVWNEVLYSQWGATKRVREERVVEEGGFKRM